MKPGTYDITPEMGRMFLKNAHPNRPVVETHVERLKNTMERGAWTLGEALVFSPEGKMMDGSHRMLALVLANVTLRFNVVVGDSYEKAYPHINSGTGRQPGHVLWTDPGGYRDGLTPRQCSRAAAALALQINYDAGYGNPYSHRQRIDRDVLVKSAYEHLGIRDSAKRVDERLFRLVVSGPAVFIHYQFSLRDADLADELTDGLATGENLNSEDVVWMLRERLLRNAYNRKSDLKIEEILALVIKAWNSKRTGTKVRQLRWRSGGEKPEPFPNIL